MDLDGARIGAAMSSFLLGALVVRLISQGQTPVRILIECVLIGAVVYLLTVVVRPPRDSSGQQRLQSLDVETEDPQAMSQSVASPASATVPEAMNASISASDLPN